MSESVLPAAIRVPERRDLALALRRRLELGARVEGFADHDAGGYHHHLGANVWAGVQGGHEIVGTPSEWRRKLRRVRRFRASRRENP